MPPHLSPTETVPLSVSAQLSLHAPLLPSALPSLQPLPPPAPLHLAGKPRVELPGLGPHGRFGGRRLITGEWRVEFGLWRPGKQHDFRRCLNIACKIGALRLR
jgi:hypothetical protein